MTSRTRVNHSTIWIELRFNVIWGVSFCQSLNASGRVSQAVLVREHICVGHLYSDARGFWSKTLPRNLLYGTNVIGAFLMVRGTIGTRWRFVNVIATLSIDTEERRDSWYSRIRSIVRWRMRLTSTSDTLIIQMAKSSIYREHLTNEGTCLVVIDGEEEGTGLWLLYFLGEILPSFLVLAWFKEWEKKGLTPLGRKSSGWPDLVINL